MMNMFPLILMLFFIPDSVKLTLRPNTTEILQRDNLLVTAVLEIKSESAITIFSAGGLERFRVELLDGEQ